MVGGTVEGEMNSDGRIEVASTGRITGNIRTKSLIVDENAVFQGQCIMNKETASFAQREPKKEQPGKEEAKTATE